MLKQIETILADYLQTITVDESPLFKTAERWKNQVRADGGVNAFNKYAPFVFVKYLPAAIDHIGSMDLLLDMDFALTIGASGCDARDKVLDIVDLVVPLIEGKHPTELIDIGDEPAEIMCDSFYLSDTTEIVDAPKAYAMCLIFTIKRVVL